MGHSITHSSTLDRWIHLDSISNFCAYFELIHRHHMSYTSLNFAHWKFMMDELIMHFIDGSCGSTISSWTSCSMRLPGIPSNLTMRKFIRIRKFIKMAFINLEHMVYILGGYAWSMIEFEHELVMEMREMHRESKELTKYDWNAFIDKHEY